ncbi:MAG TPA: alpha/beta fold hydrolase [Nitriliruptorales bacterium]|nr:alpha/beta fold hydrolase [Nitriliruptorales bacterium]
MRHVHQQQLAVQQRRQRSQLRRLLEVRGLVGGHRAPHRTVRLRTADGVRLAASYLPGPDAHAPAVVLVHGFAAHRRKPAYALLADILAGWVHVLSLDLRGHGRSEGLCTLGDLERFDVAAAIERLRHAGHRRVAVVGISMGATSLLHALADGCDVDAAVIVSAPARLGEIETDALAGLDDVWRTWWRRGAFRLLSGVRLVAPDAWRPFPHPHELAAKVDVPLLVVHGRDDHFFPPHHAETLHAAAAGPATLWLEPAGFGHAEDGITPAFAAALAQALHAVFDRGQFPARPGPGS